MLKLINTDFQKNGQKPKIFYSLAGEGLGHATRTYALLEKLTEIAEVHVFTWGEAYNFFKKMNYVHLYQIAPLHFGRKKDNSISTMKSIWNFFEFLKACPNSVEYVKELAEKLQPTLFISDFEGVLPRAAKQLSIPCLSIDNQHKFSRCTTVGLPIKLRLYAYFMGLYSEWIVPNAEQAIVSTFYHSKIKKAVDETVLTNCFVRSNFENLEIVDNSFVLLYYKVSSGDQFLNVLSKLSYDVVIYNCPKDKQIGHKYFTFKELSNEEFIRDLAQCSVLLSSAGNQLLGEAIYLGKPCFLIPEPNQPEQTINAFYVEQMGCGVNCKLTELSVNKVTDFIKSARCRPGKGINGVYETLKIVEQYL